MQRTRVKLEDDTTQEAAPASCPVCRSGGGAGGHGGRGDDGGRLLALPPPPEGPLPTVRRGGPNRFLRDCPGLWDRYSCLVSFDLGACVADVRAAYATLHVGPLVDSVTWRHGVPKAKRPWRQNGVRRVLGDDTVLTHFYSVDWREVAVRAETYLSGRSAGQTKIAIHAKDPKKSGKRKKSFD